MKKLVKRKNILKEAGVLLVVTILFLTSIAISGNSTKINVAKIDKLNQVNKAVLKTPLIADAEIVGSTGGENTGIGSLLVDDYIGYSNGIWVQSFGSTIGTMIIAIRLTPTELVGYNDCEITSVRFWHHDDGMGYTHNGNIIIYDQGSSSAPGSPLSTTPFTGASGNGLVEYSLSPPIVTINAARDLWIGVQMDHPTSPQHHPQGVSSGGVPTKSLWFSSDNGVTWMDLVSFGYLYDAMIWAGVECVNNPPIANDDTYSVCYGSITDFDVLDNDFDPDGHSINIVTGSITPPILTYGTATIVSGKIRYTHNTASGYGIDIFTYDIDDGHGGTATATVTVQVCCLEIQSIGLHPTQLDKLRVTIKNWGPNLNGPNAAEITWDFFITGAPCCGGPGYLDEPWDPLLGNIKTETFNINSGNTQNLNCKVEGNAFFTLTIKLKAGSGGCECEQSYTGCIGKLQLC